MKTRKQSSNDIVRQGSILAAASIAVRMIGLIYRIPMANIIGEEAMGIYSAAFEIYNIILILSSFSMPLAVSKLVSEKLIYKDWRGACQLLIHALIFASVIGLAASTLLYFNVDWIEQNLFSKYAGIAISLRFLAPTIFIVSILGVFRGFFQGKGTMYPTAYSQIIEQILNAVVSILAAAYLVNAHSTDTSAWGAAGGTIGTLAGALGGLVFVLFVFILYIPILKKQVKRQTASMLPQTFSIYRLLAITIIPIILSQTVYQISGVIDLFLFNNIMGNKGFSEIMISSLQGNYSTLYKLLLSVPIAISSSFAGSIVPNIVTPYKGHQLGKVKKKLHSSIQFNMNIAIPAAVGLMVVGKPVIHLLFPSYDLELGGRLLLLGSSAVIFYAHSTITSSALQGIEQMKAPVIHSSVSLVIHIVVVYLCMQFTNMGIYALLIGNITFPLVVMILNNHALKKQINYSDNVKKVFVIPLISAIIMGGMCFGVYQLLMFLTKSNMVSLMVSVITAVVVYFSLVLKLHGITSEELLEFPAGRTLLTFARKLHLVEKYG